MFIRYDDDFKVVDKVTAKWFNKDETLKDVINALVNNLIYFPQVLCETTYFTLAGLDNVEHEVEYIIKNVLSGKYTSRNLVSISRLASAILRAAHISSDCFYMSSNGCSYIVGEYKICGQGRGLDCNYVKIELGELCNELIELINSYSSTYPSKLGVGDFVYTLGDATYYYKYKNRSIVDKNLYMSNCIAVLIPKVADDSTRLMFGVEFNGTYYIFNEDSYTFAKLENIGMRSIIYRSVPNPSFGSFEKFKLNTKRKD